MERTTESTSGQTMVQTSRRVALTVAPWAPGVSLAYTLAECGRTLRRRYPSLGAAQAAAYRRRPKTDTVAVLWAQDEYTTAADAVLAQDYVHILI